MFNDLGAGSQDAVSILLPGLPQTQFAMWGAQAGCIANPINFLLRSEQIADLLNAAGSKVVVALGPHPMVDIWSKLLAIRSSVPSLKAILVVVGAADEKNDIFNFDELINKYPSDRLVSGRSFKRTDIATYFHTGGTTGSPKLAMHSQGNTIYAAWVTANMWAFESDSIMLNALPMFHVAGSIICSLSPFCVGSEVIIPTPGGFRNPVALENSWRLVEKYKCTHFGGVPTNLVALLDAFKGDTDLSSIKYCLTGGAALPLDVEKRWMEKTGMGLHQMYGMTEAGSVCLAYPARAKDKFGCVGMRLPYCDFKVVKIKADGSLGKTCKTREAGVVLLKGPNVFPGYKDASQDKQVLTDDGWLNTGDIGYTDEDGDLFLTGRSKDLIIRGAHNIDPSIIEETLNQHQAIALCAAVGKPDAYAGELPVIYATLRPGMQATQGELLEFLKHGISERPALPKEVIIIEEMPMTPVGKIFKPQLRWDITRRVYTDALNPLKQAGVNFSVAVGEDKQYGTLATVNIKPADKIDRKKIEAQIEKLIGVFTTKYKIQWE